AVDTASSVKSLGEAKVAWKDREHSHSSPLPSEPTVGFNTSKLFCSSGQDKHPKVTISACRRYRSIRTCHRHRSGAASGGCAELEPLPSARVGPCRGPVRSDRCGSLCGVAVIGGAVARGWAVRG